MDIQDHTYPQSLEESDPRSSYITLQRNQAHSSLEINTNNPIGNETPPLIPPAAYETLSQILNDIEQRGATSRETLDQFLTLTGAIHTQAPSTQEQETNQDINFEAPINTAHPPRDNKKHDTTDIINIVTGLFSNRKRVPHSDALMHLCRLSLPRSLPLVSIGRPLEFHVDVSPRGCNLERQCLDSNRQNSLYRINRAT